MAGILEYIKQYGKVSIKDAPFNDVDNLIMSEISYGPFDEFLLPEKGGAKKMKINEIAPLLHMEDREYWDEQPLIYRTAAQVLAAMGGTKRFGDMIIKNYVNHIDERSDVQFSAITIQMSRTQIYVAYRGTDDTLVGWKEDLQMSYKTPIPSQEEAREYLDGALGPLFTGELYVGGHSKGGNLAVFAGIYAKEKVRKHIVRIYNNDGPGFLKKMMNRPEYQEMLPKVKTLVPQTSMVGMLFDHEEAFTVVQSDQIGFMQHLPTSWQVIGNGFVTLEKTDLGSELMNRTVKNWLETVDDPTREAFVEALYSLLVNSGFTAAHELANVSPATVKNTVKAMSNLSDAQKLVMVKMLLTFFLEGGKSLTKIRELY